MSTASGPDHVAVVGIGCRFPGGANSPERYWRLLCDGTDAITEVPRDRFDLAEVYDADPGTPGKIYARWGGFVDGIDAFDAEFFGISPREAVRIDPQQRMLLEVVWEALEDGGLAADRLAGSNTGVFIGMSTHDYYDLQVNPGNRHLINPHSSTGTAMSIAANRISYIYDLRGPSFIVDTACSSSLTAVHLACQGLRNRECDLAIAGGVNAILSPDVAIGFCKASMLSPDGRCKAFDSRANGFVRSEGAGIVVLKPLTRAMADGDRIYAVIRGSAVNQDGRTVGIAVPSAEAQEALIREALRDAHAKAEDVQYVEAHGTGTRVGDPIEASAIGHVLSNGHRRSGPCLIGSAKTNIGHLEAAAGIAGLIKASLVLHHRQIPPTLHFREANPSIPFDDLQLRVVTSLQPLPVNGTPALVSVNSFGFGGANAHVVLQEPPASATAGVDGPDERVQILPLSARHPEALHELARRYRDLVAGDACPALPDLCHSAAVHRAHHAHRLAVVGSTREEVLEQLDEVVAAGPSGLPRGPRGREPKLAFVFTGMGPQWWAMGRQLFEQEPAFRLAIEDCDRRFRRIGTWGLLDALMADEGASRAHEADEAVATNFAIQIALVALLKSWGIVPDAILGHSAGEMAAACAAGAMSLDDGLLWAFHRGRLQHRASGSGTMLSAGLSEDAARQLVSPFEDRVSIAAINSPTSVTLSGEQQALEQIAAELGRRACFNRFLQVEVPYHGPQMDSLRAEFLDALAPITPAPPSVPFLSTVSGTWSDARLDPQYWFDNLREPVRFADAINRLIDDDYDLFLEIGPHPVLSASLSECLAARGRSGTTLPTLRRKEEERRVMLRSLATLYAHGRRVEWATVCADGALVSLPAYPWQRERLWFESEARAVRSSGQDSGHPLLGFRLRSVQPTWEADLRASHLDYLNDHIVQGSPVFPAAAYVETALAAAKALTPDAAPVVEDLTFKKVLFLTHRQDLFLQSLYDARNASFEIHSGGEGGQWTLNASGKLRGNAIEAAGRTLDLTALRRRCPTGVSVDEAYDTLEKRGLRYQGLFRGIRSLWRGQGEALAEVGLPEGHAIGPYLVHPALLDSAFQAMLAAVWSGGTGGLGSGLYLPVSLKRVTLAREPGARFWVHAEVSVADADGLEGNITILDDHGQVAVSVEGLRCKSLEDAARAKRAANDELTYRLLWEPKPLETVHARGAEPIRTSAELGASVGPMAERLADEQGWTVPLRRAEPTLDAIVSHFARAALVSLGWDGQDPAPGDTAALASRLGVVPRHHRFFVRLLEIIREVPLLDVTDGQPASERAAAHRLCEQVLADYPAADPLVDLLRRCGERLDAILRGAVDAHEVLFAPAAVSAWARFFSELPWYQFYNRTAADAIAAAVEQVPATARLRVLEIGAGTAGTTAAVLPRLEGRTVEYHFTDVSPFFLTQARDRFRHQPHVHVRSLDIEADPVAQLGPETFDVILAANVVHATADLRATLANIKQLLAPGGLLVLLEVTRKMAWTDLIFGITDGWWRFTDTDLRPDYPMLSVRRWEAFLADSGFEGPVGIAERSVDRDTPQSVILATQPAQGAGQATGARSTPGKDWLVLADATGVGERITTALRGRGDRCVIVRPGDAFTEGEDESFTIDAASVDDAARLVDAVASSGFGLHGVIHAWSLDAPSPAALTGAEAVDAQRTICGSVISLLQAFGRRGRPLPPMWLVTGGAQAVADEDRDGPNVAQAPLWGLGRVLTSEQPGVRCRTVDLGPAPGADEIGALLDEIAADDVEEEIAFRGPRRYVPRLRRARLADLARSAPDKHLSPDEHPFRLDIETPGTLESLVLREVPARRPGPGEILVRVLAAGINFRDVMLALGLLPPMALPGSGARTVLGFECAGIVMACGEGVADFRPGDEVMTVALGAFGSQVVTRAEMAARKPAHLTFEQAATVPLVFVTALYGLTHLARLSAGERVLIHAGTGGVGLAAIQLAKRAGAEIFATAGNSEKRAYLRELGVQHVMDSRSLAFADEVMTITGGEGVDVVLNSLAGEAIQKGISILRPYGRFLEMGKRDIYADSTIGLLPFDRNLAFCSIALERMCVDRPAYVGSMLREIAAALEEQALEPIPHTAFDLARAEEAFRTLAQARHIGKLVLTIREPAYPVAADTERPLYHADASYVVSGGLGGFGLQVARWMVDHGARHVVLISRSGVPAPENEAAFTALRESPANIITLKGDVSRLDDVARVFDEIRASLPPVRGVVHAAMVLEDAPLALLNADRLGTVLAPKVAGAWNLHQVTSRDTLDFFVMFSSMASVLGTKGQGNYAAANLFLDALAPYRQSIGLPGLTLNWGALSDVGYLSQHQDVAHHLERHGMGRFTPAEALGVMDEALRCGVSQLMAARIDWERWSTVDVSAVAVKRTQRLSHFASENPSVARDGAAERGSVLRLLAGAAPDERPALLEHHVVERIAKVLGTSAKKVDAERPLTEMGVDSLMAVELQTVVDKDLGVSLPLASLLEGASARQLASTLLDQLDFELPAPASEEPPTTPMPAVVAAADKHEAAPAPPPGELTPAPQPREPVVAPPPAAVPVPVPAAVPAPSRQVDRDAVPARASGIDYRSIDYSRWSPVQRFSQKLIAGLFRLVAPLEVQGLENIPRSGPVVVAANHLSMLDVALILTILPRRAICIATDSLRKHPWQRWFLDLGDTIYVRRGEADQEALAQGLAVLRAGGLLGIAPEGTRSRTGGLMKGQPGVVFMAGEAPAPILPLAAWGQERVADNVRRLRRTRIHVRVGAPLVISPGERTAARLQHDTERVMRALADLLPPAYRGVYAEAVDRPEPSMADVAAR